MRVFFLLLLMSVLACDFDPFNLMKQPTYKSLLIITPDGKIIPSKESDVLAKMMSMKRNVDLSQCLKCHNK